MTGLASVQCLGLRVSFCGLNDIFQLRLPKSGTIRKTLIVSTHFSRIPLFTNPTGQHHSKTGNTKLELKENQYIISSNRKRSTEG